MRSLKVHLVTLLAGLLLALPAAALPRFSPEDVFHLSWVSDPQVDTRGERVVYLRHGMDVVRDQPVSQLWRIDTDGGNHRPVTTGWDRVSSPVLSPEGRRVAYVRKDEAGQQLFVTWLDSGQTTQLTRLPRTPGQLAWSPDGQWLAYRQRVVDDAPVLGEMPKAPEGAEWAPPPTVVERAIFRNDGKGMAPRGYDHVFVIAAAGGSPRQLTRGDFHHSGGIAWAADSRSLVVSANRNPDWELDTQNTDLYRVSLVDGSVSALTERRGRDDDPVVSPDGRLIAWTGWDDRGMGYHRNRLYVMNSDGSERRELLAELDRSIQSPRWAADGRRLVFRYDDRGETVLASVDPGGRLQELARGIGGTSIGRPYSGADHAVGGQGVVAWTGGEPGWPADLVLGRLGDSQSRRLTRLNDNLLPYRELGQLRELEVTSSADERAVQAWVLTPPGFDPGQRYPMVLEIHGGPFANYGPRFSAEMQLLAAAGYVVLYVNPRGSTSYGEEFANLIHHNYPGQDYDDLMSAVDALLAEGYVDPEQLFVTGGSGGGTLTAWIVGKTDRFRAAVVAKPVINWASFVLTADMTPYFARYWFGEMPWENPEAYWRRSPLSLVGKVTTPTALLTGENDLRTPMSETEQYYHALRLRGVDTAMVRVPGASHSIARRPSQLVAKVAAILGWFERYRGETAGGQ